MTSCIVGNRTSLLLFVLPCIIMFTFLSPHAFSTVIFVKDISKTIQDRNFIFGIQVGNDKLYLWIENDPYSICSSLYLFFFLSLHIFVKDISTTV